MFCAQCGARNEDGSRFCTSCGAPLTQPAPVVEEPAPAPVVVEPAPAPVAEEPAPAPVVEEAPAPVVVEPTPAPVAPVAPVNRQPVSPTAPLTRERPLIGVIVLSAIAMLLEFVHLIAAVAGRYIGTSGYNFAYYFLFVFTVLTLFLVGAIIPNLKLRSILGGIGVLTLSLNTLLLAIDEFSYVARMADYFSDSTALVVVESVWQGILLLLASLFFLIGGILAFIKLKGKGLRVTGSVLLLLVGVNNLLFLFLNALVYEQSIRFIGVVNYFVTLMTAVAVLAFCVGVKRRRA